VEAVIDAVGWVFIVLVAIGFSLTYLAVTLQFFYIMFVVMRHPVLFSQEWEKFRFVFKAWPVTAIKLTVDSVLTIVRSKP
jgi:hypothetical protein